MAERQQAHNHSQERIALDHEGTILEQAGSIISSDFRIRNRGLAAGFVLSLLGIGGSIYLIATGHDWAGVTLGGINLTGLAGVFVYGARRAGQRRNVEPES